MAEKPRERTRSRAVGAQRLAAARLAARASLALLAAFAGIAMVAAGAPGAAGAARAAGSLAAASPPPRVAGAAAAGAGAWQPPAPELIERARRLLREVPLIDGHNDLPWQLRERYHDQLGKLDLRRDASGLRPPLYTDIPRLRRGGVGGQFWSVYVPVELGGPAAVQAVPSRSTSCTGWPSCIPTPSRWRPAPPT